MRLAPGEPLAIGLWAGAGQSPLSVARAGWAGGLAQLEWSPEVIAAARDLSAYLYPPQTGLIEARGREFSGLHGFLADSLPDAWGQMLMQRRLARNGVQIASLSPLDRLALVGSRGRGALVFQPATLPPDDVETLDLDALAAESTAILMGQESRLVDTLARLGGASGGARPKVHVGFDSRGGVSISEDEPTEGHESWIVKFRADGDLPDAGAMEEAYAVMARVAGIAVAPSRLLPAKAGPGYFATRRFDRPEPGRRIHMVSLSGAVEAPSRMPSFDYDMFLRATLAITRHADDVRAAFRRMVFNILAFNRDDHTGQHSYLLTPEGWRLAPAYDLTWSTGPGGEHWMAVEGEGRSPARAAVNTLGARHGLSTAVVAQIVDDVRAALADWPERAVDAGVSRTTRVNVGRAHDTAWSGFGR